MRRKRTRAGRASRASMLAESVMVTALFLPILVAVLLVTLESSYAFVIDRSMEQGARLAARALAVYHGSNPEVVTNTSEQQAIFNQIRIQNMISGNAQFAIPPGGWNTTATPPTVTVVVTYLSGSGTPPLPTFPAIDPLHLGSAYYINAAATYALE